MHKALLQIEDFIQWKIMNIAIISALEYNRIPRPILELTDKCAGSSMEF